MRSVNIPFAGFYCSVHDDAMDYALEQIFTNSSGDPLGGKFADAWKYVDWRAAKTAYAKAYALGLCELLELKGAEFEEMVSPREYNFETDRLFVLLPDEEVKRMLDETPRGILDRKAEDHFTSRSGFISHYPNKVEDWPPFEEWDHNHLLCLFEAYLEHREGKDFDEWSMCEDFNSNGNLDNWLFTGCKPELQRLDKLACYLRKRQERKYRAPPVQPEAHLWQHTGLDTHKGEYWYRCSRCGASDWTASYGTMDQLTPRDCPGPSLSPEPGEPSPTEVHTIERT